MREGEAPSFFNPMEATMLVDLLERLLHEQEEYPAESRITSKDIGVIATYRKQVAKSLSKPLPPFFVCQLMPFVINAHMRGIKI